RLCARDNQLIVEANPSTTTELLPEWEETMGLPDPCAGPAPTIDQRRAQVLARFANSGGQSIPFFIAYALTLGYAITITVYTPYTFGMVFGLPMYGDAFIFAWTVNAPLAAEANNVLECEFERLKPAHTTVNFIYS
ncbi:YmfQ family protein, partial [Lacticaseibacillus paracasei]|uniref:YmfQ family protein n=1 Tax=Lacticaseibacillus paracasei TaxID=1597 RepID=UPI00194E8234